MTVRFRPQADAPRYRLRQRVLEVELAVEPALDLGAGDADFQVVPLAGRGRGVADPFDRRAPALLELPQHQIVLEAVGANGEVVAVRLEIEQDAGALVDPAGDALEPHRDLAV